MWEREAWLPKNSARVPGCWLARAYPCSSSSSRGRDPAECAGGLFKSWVQACAPAPAYAVLA
eukprot:1687353-Prymnesium_polylepis.1